MKGKISQKEDMKDLEKKNDQTVMRLSFPLSDSFKYK